MSVLGKYNEHDLSFTANQNQVHNEVGDQIIFLGGSGAFTFKVDGGVSNEVRAGISFKMPEGQTFKRITFNETAGASGNILFAIASGNIVDARSVISGETPVQNAASPNDELQVKTKSGTVLDVNVTNQVPHIDLAGHTHIVNNHGLTLTNHTLVSAAANTNGVLFSYATIQSYDSNHYCIFYMDDLDLFGRYRYQPGDLLDTLTTPLLIPAGKKFSVSKTTNARMTCVYKQL